METNKALFTAEQEAHIRKILGQKLANSKNYQFTSEINTLAENYGIETNRIEKWIGEFRKQWETEKNFGLNKRLRSKQTAKATVQGQKKEFFRKIEILELLEKGFRASQANGPGILVAKECKKAMELSEGKFDEKKVFQWYTERIQLQNRIPHDWPRPPNPDFLRKEYKKSSECDEKRSDEISVSCGETTSSAVFRWFKNEKYKEEKRKFMKETREKRRENRDWQKKNAFLDLLPDEIVGLLERIVDRSFAPTALEMEILSGSYEECNVTSSTIQKYFDDEQLIEQTNMESFDDHKINGKIDKWMISEIKKSFVESTGTWRKFQNLTLENQILSTFELESIFKRMKNGDYGSQDDDVITINDEDDVIVVDDDDDDDDVIIESPPPRRSEKRRSAIQTVSSKRSRRVEEEEDDDEIMEIPNENLNLTTASLFQNTSIVSSGYGSFSTTATSSPPSLINIPHHSSRQEEEEQPMAYRRHLPSNGNGNWRQWNRNEVIEWSLNFLEQKHVQQLEESKMTGEKLSQIIENNEKMKRIGWDEFMIRNLRAHFNRVKSSSLRI